jgi:cysteine desulfurase
MGMDPDRARSSIRFSLGQATTGADVDAALEVVPAAVQRLMAAAA